MAPTSTRRAAAAAVAGAGALFLGTGPCALPAAGAQIPPTLRRPGTASSSRGVDVRASEGPAAGAAPPVVAVVGAGGRTGALVVEALLKRGAAPRALTKSGRWTGADKDKPLAQPPPGVEVGRADVLDASSLTAALAGAAAVVFAAAFTRGSSLPKDIDNAGLVRTAEVVRQQGIGRLIVVSSAAVTRPYAPVGVLLNTVGSGVLMEKLKGESEMKGLLRGSGCTYTIVRPGGLKMGPAAGFEKLEFNQGDTLVGSVQRADVAAVCAEAALDAQNRGAGKTFEMYEAAGRNGLLPWYGGSKYVVAGQRDCGGMLGRLLPDEDVTDVPGFLPF